MVDVAPYVEIFRLRYAPLKMTPPIVCYIKRKQTRNKKKKGKILRTLLARAAMWVGLLPRRASRSLDFARDDTEGGSLGQRRVG